MHFWNRELINHSRLENDHDRYLFSLASLRLGKINQSRQTIKTGSSNFQNQTKVRLLLIELDIKDKKYKNAKRSLYLIENSCKKSKEHSSQWQHLLDRCKTTADSKKLTLPQTPIEWQRTLSVQNKNPKLLIEFLKWHIQKGSMLHEDLLDELTPFSRYNSYQLYQIFDTLKDYPSQWESLIDHMFKITTLKNKEPEKMWSHWLKHCPKDKKPLLQQKMEHTLQKQPNWKLEEILVQSKKV